MKLLSKTLMMCAVASLSAGLPAFSTEQNGSVSNDDQNFESELLSVLPATAEVAVLPEAPTPADETVGAGMEHGGHEGKWHGGGMHHKGILGSLEGPLAVTDDQYEKLYSLRNAYLDRIAPKTMQIGQLHRQMKDALVSANLDAKAVSDLGGRINGLKNEIATAKLDRVIASAQVLTPDQRKALHDRMIRHSVEMEHMGGEHGGHHGHH